jgi:hypothetical protein
MGLVIVAAPACDALHGWQQSCRKGVGTAQSRSVTDIYEGRRGHELDGNVGLVIVVAPARDALQGDNKKVAGRV